MISRRGEPCTIALGASAGKVPGSIFTTISVKRCAAPRVASRLRARQSSTAKASRPPKKGVHGYDAGKKINGRKRHISVDTIGLILAVVVHSAAIQDRDGAKLVIARLAGLFPRLKLIWADGGYAGQLVEWVKNAYQLTLEIVKKPDGATGFSVLPRRWVVERTLAWLGRCRRLSKDYEQLTESSECMVQLAMIALMGRRMARSQAP